MPKPDPTPPEPVSVKCLICWTVFTTNEEDFEKGRLRCPAEGCGSEALIRKGAFDPDD